MKKSLVFIIFCLSLISCKPTFDLRVEQSKINNLALGNLGNEDFIENYPNFLKDSLPIEKINARLDSIRLDLSSTFYRKKDVVSNEIIINKISSTRKIGGIYFKIINYSNLLEVQKNKQNRYLYDFKKSLKQNLISYSEDTTNLNSILSTKFEDEILAFFEKDSNQWKYLSYSDLGNEALFGLKAAQDIIDLYFDDIFIPAETRLDKEYVAIFQEVYEEDRKDYEKDVVNFDKYVKCRIKYQEKAEEYYNGEIPDEYYNSLFFIQHSLKCRIYSITN